MPHDPVAAADKVFKTITNGEEYDRRKVFQFISSPNVEIDYEHLRTCILDALRTNYKNMRSSEYEWESQNTNEWLIELLGRISAKDDKAKAATLGYLDFNADYAERDRFYALVGLIEAKVQDIHDQVEKTVQSTSKIIDYGAVQSIKDGPLDDGLGKTLESSGAKLPPGALIEKQSKSSWIIYAEGQDLYYLELIGPDLILVQAKYLYLRKLAVVFLAEKGDMRSKKEIELTALDLVTLNALTFISIPAVTEQLCYLIDTLENPDIMNDAIMALGKLPPKPSPFAEQASLVLRRFVAYSRQYDYYTGLRALAICSLGMLKDETAEKDLMKELKTDNPFIVREAALALENILGIETACDRIVETIIKLSPDSIAGYGDALRWMERKNKNVVEVLEAIMQSGQPQEQDTARMLLREIGGVEALKKLDTRARTAEDAMKLMARSEKGIQDQFNSSIIKARQGFNVAMAMDVTIFLMGVLLIVSSATLILVKGETLDAWIGAGAGAAGGGGAVATALNNTFIAKPREKIVKNTDHLMYLQLIYLGYTHQLNEIGLAYSRHIVEGKNVDPAITTEYINVINQITNDAIARLAHKDLYLISGLKVPKELTGEPEKNDPKTRTIK